MRASAFPLTAAIEAEDNILLDGPAGTRRITRNDAAVALLQAGGDSVYYRAAAVDAQLSVKQAGIDAAFSSAAAALALAAAVRDGGLGDGTVSAAKLKTGSDADKVRLANLAAEVIAALAGSLSAADYLAEISSLSQAIATAAGNTGKWYAISVAGTLSGTNAPAIVVGNGDRLVSNGTVWQRYAAPPTNVPDLSVTRAKLEAGLANLVRDDGGFPSTVQWAVLDAVGRLGLWLTDAGVVKGKFALAPGTVANGLAVAYDPITGVTALSLGSQAGTLPLGTSSVGEEANDVYAFALLDSAQRVALGVRLDGTVEGRFSVAELITARGERATLADRLAPALTPRGYPVRHSWGEWTLRDFRRLAGDRLAGSAATINVLLLGDSYTQGGSDYTRKTKTRLQTALGDAGEGWVGLGGTFYGAGPLGAADTGRVTATRTGTWSYTTDYAGRGADLAGATSSSVGALATVTLASGVSADAAIIHYLTDAGAGSFRWRVNGGAWTTVATAGSLAIATASAGAIPAAGNLEIEVVSGPVTLLGVDLQKTASGVRVHKLGHAGGRTSHFAAAPATWEAAVGALSPHLVVIMLGTNDQGGVMTEAEYRTNLATMIARLRSVRAGLDIVLAVPPENLAGRATPMTVYRDAAYRVAVEQRCAFLDHLRVFGESVGDYNDSAPRVLFSTADTIHPQPAGYSLLADTTSRLLLTP